MTLKTTYLSLFLGTALCAALFFVPGNFARAGGEEALRGGGNALFRATMGVSHASLTSQLLARLAFASEQGGQPETVPPQEQTSATTPQGNEDAHTQGGTQGNNSTGGSATGQGGNGGDGAQGGLIRAGSVVTHARALTVLNTVIIRIGN